MIPSQNLNSEFGESENFSSEIFISIIISRRSKPRRIGIIAPPSSFEKRVVGFAASRHGRLTPLISRELPEGWRTLAASKKTKRDKERLITYAKTVKSRVVRLIENSLCNLDSKSFVFLANFYIFNSEKKFIIAEINFLLLYSVLIGDTDKT